MFGTPYEYMQKDIVNCNQIVSTQLQSESSQEIEQTPGCLVLN